jgi:hypothetical protein
VVALTETLTILANEFLGVDPFLKVASAVAILFMSLALVGLATGLGARYPRFNAENPTQVAGSYGGVMFMVLAVLFVIIACVLVGWPSSIISPSAAGAPDANSRAASCLLHAAGVERDHVLLDADRHPGA